MKRGSARQEGKLRLRELIWLPYQYFKCVERMKLVHVRLAVATAMLMLFPRNAFVGVGVSGFPVWL